MADTQQGGAVPWEASSDRPAVRRGLLVTRAGVLPKPDAPGDHRGGSRGPRGPGEIDHSGWASHLEIADRMQHPGARAGPAGPRRLKARSAKDAGQEPTDEATAGRAGGAPDRVLSRGEFDADRLQSRPTGRRRPTSGRQRPFDLRSRRPIRVVLGHRMEARGHGAAIPVHDRGLPRKVENSGSGQSGSFIGTPTMIRRPGASWLPARPCRLVRSS